MPIFSGTVFINGQGIFMKHFLAIFLFTLALCNISPPALAQEENAGHDSEETVNYFYEQPTMKKLSQLYWGISMNDISNDKHIDNYLFINECDIYKDYFPNEFEWKIIRDSARAYIKANKKNFPVRFEFIQPIKLGKYDTERNRFDILEEFQVEGKRRFEILSQDYLNNTCGAGPSNLEGYPRGFIIELSRPFTLTHLAVDPVLAEKYITETAKFFAGKDRGQTEEALHEKRDAYLIMKVKIFASKEDRAYVQGIEFGNVAGVLEGFDIYTTADKQMPLFSKSFRKRKRSSATEPISNNDGDISDPLPEKSPEAIEEEFEP